MSPSCRDRTVQCVCMDDHVCDMCGTNLGAARAALPARLSVLEHHLTVRARRRSGPHPPLPVINATTEEKVGSLLNEKQSVSRDVNLTFHVCEQFRQTEYEHQVGLLDAD